MVISLIKNCSIAYNLQPQEAKDATMKVLEVLSEMEDTHDELLTVKPGALESLSESIVTLWSDEGFKSCYSRSNEYQVTMSWTIEQLLGIQITVQFMIRRLKLVTMTLFSVDGLR